MRSWGFLIAIFVVTLSFVSVGTGYAANPLVNDAVADPEIIKSSASTTITYTLDDIGVSRVVIEIYDSYNALVRSIDQGIQSSGPYSIVWDGCDDHGVYLVDGIYSVRINSTDIYTFSKKWGNRSDIVSSTYPTGLAVNGSGYVYMSGLQMYLTSGGSKLITVIYIFSPEGAYQKSLVLSESGSYDNFPIDIAFNSSGYLFVAEPSRVEIFSPDLSYYGAFGSAGNGTGEFMMASGIDIDQSNDHIYIADMLNNRIQAFDHDSNFINAWGLEGAEPGNFHWPCDLAINSSGYVYVADYANSHVQIFSSDGLFQSTWDMGAVGDVSGIAINDSDFVYVCNGNSDDINVYDMNGNFLYTWDIVNQPLTALMYIVNIPIAIGLNNNVYFANINVNMADMSMSNHICMADPGGNTLDTINFKPQPGGFHSVSNIAVNSTGYTYAVDGTCIQIFDPDGNFAGFVDSLSRFPNSIAINSSDYVYVTDYRYGTVYVYDPENNFVRSWSVTYDVFGMMSYAYLFDIAIDENDNVYVSNLALSFFSNYKILIFDPYGNQIGGYCGGNLFDLFFDFLTNPPSSEDEFLDKWNEMAEVVGNMGDFSEFSSIDINSTGYLYAVVNTNSTYSHVLVLNRTGIVVNAWGEYGSEDGMFITPRGIAINSSDHVFVADTGNDRFQVFDPYGNFVTRLGVNGSADGELKGPAGIEIDGDDVYVADTGNYRVQVFEHFNNVSGDVDVYVDSTPPVSSVALSGTSGTNGWHTSDVTGTITGIDEVSGVRYSQYSFDNNSWTDGQTFTVSNEGAHIVYYRSIDYGDNVEAAKNVTISVDKTLPEAYCSLDGAPGSNGWYVSEVAVTLAGDDGLSGLAKIEYGVDGSGWADYGGSFNISDGQHTLTYRSVDAAGNVGNTESETIKVDRHAPSISSSVSGSKASQGWFDSDVTVTLMVSDAASGVNKTEYSIDGVNWNTYAGTFTVQLGMQKTIYYRSLDYAGNLAESGQFIYFPPQNVPYSSGDNAPIVTPAAIVVPEDTSTPTATPTIVPFATPVAPTAGAPDDSNGMPWGILLILLVLVIIAGVAVYYYMFRSK